MTDMSLNILIRAQDQASAVLRGLVGGPAALLIGGLGALGIASVKSAADFQTAMLSNVAHAGLAKNQFDAVSKSVLAMSTEVGRSPTQLAEALYPILSAFSGIQNQTAKSAIALDTLRMSFQAVAGTTVNGADVANAAVGTFNALGLATNNVSTNTARMKNLFDVMDLTVQLGNMQWDAYKNVISKLAVSIQGTGIKFNEASAALATLTNEGYSAQRAQTYLSNMFTVMAIKTDAMAMHARKLHLTFNEQSYSAMDLAHKIEYLNQVTGGNKQELLALLGGNATALKSFNALSVGLDSYKSNLNSLNHAHGALASSFATASQGFNFSMDRLKASFDVVLITIGTMLLPVLTKLVNAITPVVAGLALWILQSQSLFQMLTDKVSPAVKILTALSYWLALELSRDLKDSITLVYDQFYALAQQMLTTGGVLDAFTQSSQWILNTGAPVYTAYAHVVGDLLGGSYQKLGSDALAAARAMAEAEVHVVKMELTLGSHGLSALKNIKMPAMGGMPGGGMLEQMLGPIEPFLQQMGKIFGGIGQFFKGLFQPFIDEWNRVATALMPSFIQFGMWWQQTMNPLFAQLAGNAKNTKSPLKEVLDIFGNFIIIGAKVGMILIEYLLPTLVRWWGILFKAIKPIIDIMSWWSNFLATDGVDTFKEFFVVASNVVTEAGRVIGDVLGGIKQTWTDVFVNGIGPIIGWVNDRITQAVELWKQAIGGFGPFVASVFHAIPGMITDVLNFIIGQIDTIISAIDSIHANTPFGPVGFNIPLIPLIMNGSASTGIGGSIPSFAGGVENFSGGLAYVHQDELLVNMAPGTSVKRAGSFGGGQTINVGGVTVNAAPGQNVQQIAQAVIDAISDGARFQGVIQNFNSGGLY